MGSTEGFMSFGPGECEYVVVPGWGQEMARRARWGVMGMDVGYEGEEDSTE
jgi:hypothetical protein